jgi:carbamoyltransferase
MKILGISCHYHEAAAALIIDGKIVAATAQERLSRKKHDADFPDLAINWCLSQAHLSVHDLDYVVFYEKPLIKFDRHLRIALAFFPHTLGWFVESMRNSLVEKLWIKSIIVAKLGIEEERVLFVPQHLSHAAASFYPSPFADAAVLTLDGVGEWTTGTMGEAHGHRVTMTSELRFPHSVGLLYSAITAFLGFEVNDGEYKVMGMAGFGKPIHIDRVRKLFTHHADGSITLHLQYFSFHRNAHRMYTRALEALFAGCDRFDIAASIQQVTEEIVLRMADVLYEKTKLPNLVYGGGVALNSVINAALLAKTKFKRVFIFRQQEMMERLLGLLCTCITMC